MSDRVPASGHPRLVDSATSTSVDIPHTAEQFIGRIIDDRYEVLELLAEGGMGTVFIAQHLRLAKQVALKTIHPELAGDQELAERFAREAMVTAKLDHPHVASALDYGTLPEGGAYLIMQLVRGPSLQDVVERGGRLSWPRVCAIGVQVADALSAAHAEGIIHRDLKPENVLLEPRDDGSELVKVLDFGIARIGPSDGMTPATSGTGARLTRRGTVMGTPGYMSPEQALGEAVDARSDLYALGTLVWEALAGRQLWEGESLTDIVAEQLSGDRVARLSVVSEDPSIPPALQELTDALLSRKPVHRPENAAQVRDAFRELALRATVSGDPRARLTPPAGMAPSRPDPSTAPTLPSHALGSERARTSWRTVAFALGGSLLLALIVVVVMLATFDPDPEENAELVEQIYRQAQVATRAEELARQTSVLLNDRNRDLRRSAGAYILDYEPADEIEEWVRVIAQLEVASGCNGLREALQSVRELGDARVRDAVERRIPLPRRRNGMRRDPYRCVRAARRQTLDALSVEE